MKEGYRPNVGIVLVNEDGLVLGCSRNPLRNSKHHVGALWQMPQGGIDAGEDIIKAARRELLEETGVDQADFVAVTDDWLAYDFPEGYGPYCGEFKGQCQKWVLFKYKGDDIQADFSRRTDPDDEFTECGWKTPEFLIEHIVFFKKDIYRNIFTIFKSFVR